jgi:Mlc titration factor MtfA (ptsG expression regulator)
MAVLWETGTPMVHVIAWPPLAAALVFWGLMRQAFRRQRVSGRTFSPRWRRTLEHVGYYVALDGVERRRFERDVAIFLDQVEVTGVGTTVNDGVRLLVASSAVMLTFGRPGWVLTDVPEILVYPTPFDERFRRASRHVDAYAGMMVPRNAVALSKSALIWSFRHDEPYHVGLHEFAHFLDMEDGRFDGVPRGLGGGAHRRWQMLIDDELARVRRGDSALDEYAGTNEAETFAVAVEHFFKAPDRLRRRHPDLYEALRDYLNQDPARRP